MKSRCSVAGVAMLALAGGAAGVSAQVIQTANGPRTVSYVPPPPAPVPVEQSYLKRINAEPGVIALPGLSYRTLKSGPGTGTPPDRADSITVRYVGRFIDGTIFNSSPNGGKATTSFELSKLIPGWVAGLRLMRPGDEFELFVPAYLAYGAQGKPSYIPPYATLIFDVELVSVTVAPSVPPIAAPKGHQ